MSERFPRLCAGLLVALTALFAPVAATPEADARGHAGYNASYGGYGYGYGAPRAQAHRRAKAKARRKGYGHFRRAFAAQARPSAPRYRKRAHAAARPGVPRKPASAPLAGPGPQGPRELSPGMLHFRRILRTAAGPMAVNVLKADPNRAEVRSLVVQRPGGGFGRAKVSAIARNTGALAAINGSFFSFKNNEPAGLMVLDGQIVSSSPVNRSVFGIRYDGTPFIDNARLKASVLLDDGREFTIARVNHQPGPDQLSLYTSHYGRSTRSGIHPYRYEVALDATGTVIEASNGDLPIPAGGFVISANGRAFRSLYDALQPGARALVYTRLAGEWEGVRYAIGGGPTILKDGRVHVTAKQERFGGHIASGRAPRTAIGYTADGSTLLVTVDGRQPRYSVGCTLLELARLMKSLGAHEAINLDGGGSSTMVVQNKLVNRVSGGSERLVSNAIGLFPRY